MTGWFRWWNGAFNDAKFGLVALRAKRSVPDVLAVWIALLEHAAQAADRGAIDDCRPEEIAWHLRIEDSAVESIIAAMTDRGMIKDGRIEAWERRQPAREDAVNAGSKPVSQRVSEHRERNRKERESARNADVTQCNAGVTPQNRTDTEQNRTESTPIGDPAAADDENPQHPGSATPMPADVEPLPISGELLPAIVQMPAKRQPSDDGGAQAACRATWVAYSGAYLDRYGVEPVRNAKVNAAIKGFTRRIGADESPDVARYYVWHADAYYARKCHDAGAMLADAEKLRTEWATKRQVTGVSARQQERSGTMCNAVDRILAKREATA